MKIEIIAVGKVREKYIKLGIDEFKKRLQPYCTLVLTEVRDEQAPDYLNDKQIELLKEREGERVLQKINGDASVIALDVAGGSLSSEGFAQQLESISNLGKNHLIFIIGGSHGLDREVIKRANKTVSFSRMTFPHQLMKLILLEQIYRAFKIQRGETYHK